MYEHSLRGYLDISVYTGGGSSSIQGDSAKTFKGKLALQKAKSSFFIGSANSTYICDIFGLPPVHVRSSGCTLFVSTFFFLVRFDGNDIIITLSRPLSTALFLH
jgi:hypothetical protein